MEWKAEPPFLCVYLGNTNVRLGLLATSAGNKYSWRRRLRLPDIWVFVIFRRLERKYILKWMGFFCFLSPRLLFDLESLSAQLRRRACEPVVDSSVYEHLILDTSVVKCVCVRLRECVRVCVYADATRRHEMEIKQHRQGSCLALGTSGCVFLETITFLSSVKTCAGN